MRISKLIYFVFIILIQHSCQKLDEKETENLSNYPEKIQEIGIEKFYDKAKWIFYVSNFDIEQLYCGHSPQKMNYKVNLLALDVKQTFLREFNDTIEIEFLFELVKDSIYCFGSDDINNYYIFGTKKGMDTILYRLQGGKINPPTIDDCFSDTLKYYDEIIKIKKLGGKSYQQQEKEFIEYIQTTNDSINLWLRKELIKRGVLK